MKRVDDVGAFPRSPSRRPTCPPTCSGSSITTSSPSAAPTATPRAGDPIQYDELRIEHDQGAVEIVVSNRAILLFTTDKAVAAGSPGVRAR